MTSPLRPILLNVFYTNRCNSRCTTCRLWAQPPVCLSPSLLRRLPQFIDLERLREVYVTGGEPLLGQEVVEIVAAIDEIKPDLRFSCDTNGLEPERYLQHVGEILARGVKLKVGVSLNGGSQLHDKTRGVIGAYGLAVRMAGLLQQSGALWKFTYVPMRETSHEDLDHLRDLAAQFGVPLTPSDYRVGPRVGLPRGAQVARFDCNGADQLLVVQPNGDLTPCEERPELVLANLGDERLDESLARAIQTRVKQHGCQPCGNTCQAWHGDYQCG